MADIIQPQSSPFGGFLGLPTGVNTRPELIRHKRQMEIEKFKDTAARMAESVPAADRVTFELFARLGEAVGSKFDKKERLTQEEEQGLSIMEESNKRMAELRTTADFQKLDPIEQSFQMQQIVADETARAGDFEMYSQIATDLFQKKIAHRNALTSQRKLESDADAAELSLSAKTFDFENLQEQVAEGQPVQMVRMVKGQPDLDAPITVVQDPITGKLVDEDGKQVSFGEVMPLDAALSLSESQTKQAATLATAAGSADAGFVQLERFVGVSEGSKLRQQLTDMGGAVETIDRAVTAFEKVTDPQTIVGTQGALLGFANNLLNTVEGTAKNIRIFASEDAQGNGTGESRSLVDAADEFIEDDEVPEQFRSNASASLQYKSAMMQLLYADARLEEPGARQLSDADIANAKERLGVSSGDPGAVIGNLSSVMQKRLDKTLFHFDNIKGMAVERNLDPQRAIRRIVGRDPTEELDKQRQRLAEIVGRGAATTGDVAPGQPAPAFTGTAEEEAFLKGF